MQFAPSVRWRASKRGLVLAGTDGDALLIEHPRATDLPALLAGAADPEGLVQAWGADTRPLVDELLELGLLRTEADHAPPQTPAPTPEPRPGCRLRLTRSGLEVEGIDGPARRVARLLGPLWLSWPGRALLLVAVVAGAVSVVHGRPPVPAYSARPWVDALLGVALSLACACLHELAHAVALTHYGRRPRRAGCGFYWGGLSFFVDSTEALTLPRRARVVQALVGLAVDLVTLSLLAVTAQLSTSPLLAEVTWRVTLLGLLSLVINLLPVLTLDGHWALADYLDEPELAHRARATLGSAIRSRTAPRERWLAVYGAISLVGGVVLLVGAAFMWWAAAGDLAAALFTGDLPDVVAGIVLIGPFAAGLIFSTLGLVLDVAAAPGTPEPHESHGSPGSHGSPQDLPATG